MKVSILSRQKVEKMSPDEFPKNAAVISFYDPEEAQTETTKESVDYTGKAERVFKVAIRDIDLQIFPKYNLSYETYFPEADSLAEFIYSAAADNLDIICQCEYGESRSSGCAAAILEHFYKTGITIFADYRYYPNQVVYHKVFEALEKYKCIFNK